MVHTHMPVPYRPPTSADVFTNVSVVSEELFNNQSSQSIVCKQRQGALITNGIRNYMQRCSVCPVKVDYKSKTIRMAWPGKAKVELVHSVFGTISRTVSENDSVINLFPGHYYANILYDAGDSRCWCSQQIIVKSARGKSERGLPPWIPPSHSEVEIDTPAMMPSLEMIISRSVADIAYSRVPFIGRVVDSNKQWIREGNRSITINGQKYLMNRN